MSTPVVAATEIKVSPAPAVITLKGKVALVTGSSRGIGQGIALSLARDGAKVVINYNSDKKSADAVVAAIDTIASGAAIAVQGDISKSADVDRVFAEAKRVFGRVDIVVANSGIAGASTIAAMTNDAFDRMIATNLTGTFYTLRAAANNIEDNGRVIVIGSGHRMGIAPGYGAYGATKAAIETLSNTLAQELGGRGITVNTVHPGAVATDMMLAAPAAIIAWATSITPQKRLGIITNRIKHAGAHTLYTQLCLSIGTIQDLGDAVALLASESGRWISGQAIHVNGASKF